MKTKAIVGAYCGVCNRPLSDPVSIKIGIGPVCRAKELKQGVLDFMHAETKLAKHERGRYIFVRDIGHNVGRSVTNDAEYIVGQLYLEFGITDETRIFYEDSDGSIDELLHNGKQFSGFKIGHKDVDL
jgi:hypothetical protein